VPRDTWTNYTMNNTASEKNEEKKEKKEKEFLSKKSGPCYIKDSNIVSIITTP